jgi:hypothetical protein
MKQFAVAFVLIASFASSATASEDTFSRLVGSRSLQCTFGPGASADWKSGKPFVQENKFDTVLQFDAIDLKAKKARLIGNQGASDVAALVTPAGVTFIEETGFGNLSITTVFSDYAKGTREFVVVHSRHIGGLGSPLPSQYHGTCKVWE